VWSRAQPAPALDDARSSAVPRPNRGAVLDSVIQEIDVTTGLITLGASQPYLVVEALDAGGRVLGTSITLKT
jgi:hypothetical protein